MVKTVQSQAIRIHHSHVLSALQPKCLPLTSHNLEGMERREEFITRV